MPSSKDKDTQIKVHCVHVLGRICSFAGNLLSLERENIVTKGTGFVKLKFCVRPRLREH